MFSTCANPECRAEFNYRQGAIFRFRKQSLKDGQLTKNDSLQHFWLCAVCAETYRLEYRSGHGVLLKRVSGNTAKDGLLSLVVATA